MKEEIKQALIKARSEASYDVLTSKVSPESDYITDAQVNALIEILPQWYKTSPNLPGSHLVKEPEGGNLIVVATGKLNDTIFFNSGTYHKYEDDAPMFYWYPVEPLTIEK